MRWPLIALISFIFVFAFVAYDFLAQNEVSFANGFSIKPRVREWSWQGVKVLSKGEPTALLREGLPRHVIMQQLVYEGLDERNAAIAAIGAEIAFAIAASNKSIGIYATLQNGTSINCINETNNCSSPHIIVAIGDCNCLEIGQKIIVNGSAQFMRERARAIGALFGSALVRS